MKKINEKGPREMIVHVPIPLATIHEVLFLFFSLIFVDVGHPHGTHPAMTIARRESAWRVAGVLSLFLIAPSTNLRAAAFSSPVLLAAGNSKVGEGGRRAAEGWGVVSWKAAASLGEGLTPSAAVGEGWRRRRHAG